MTRPVPAPPGRRAARLRRAALLGGAGLLAACAPEGVRDSITDPASPQAAALDGLFWFSLLLGVAVWFLVLGLLAVPIVRSIRARRRGDAPIDGPGDEPRVPVPASEADGPVSVAEPHTVADAQADLKVRTRLIWIGGIIGPAVILVVLLVYSSFVGRATAHVAQDDELVIEVVGHAFWWEVRYPELDIVTANEIHVPVGQNVRLELTTNDVIHSFWIPRLHGKIDMIPGRVNDLVFEADQVGNFRGHCAEFCGIAHAQMIAFVEAQEPDDFDAWVAGQQQDASEPATSEGEQVFLQAGCAACHAVGGTAAVAQIGPDLTHLASRGTLAAGIVPNTRDNLEQLIVDPWSVKPGIAMPPTELSADELDALLDYLEGLEPQEARP